MDKAVVIPQPQKLIWQDGPPLQIPDRIVLRAEASELEQLAAARLALAVERAIGRQVLIETQHDPDDSPAFRLYLASESNTAEAYRLYDDGQSVHLVGHDPVALSHAVETARQLLTRAGWPRCRIEDWPEYQHRGIYVESFWGTDLMTLADWQRFVDYLVSLKFNTLNVGLHGCWEIKYNGVPTEFLMVPLHNYPQLQSPQTVRYIEPESLTWVEETYLPRSFERDFWPELFGYARARGLRIVPQFGGPGHNTLIPRLMPELSARNEDGSPTYYGYCISSSQTWDFLRTVFSELVERYCLPFQVQHFNIAGDEVYPIRNVLPEDPNAEVSPWCACPACRQLSHFEQLSVYLLGLAELLAQHGIRAVIWADSLDRMGEIEAFKEAVARRNLEDQVVLQWWGYKEPFPELTSVPELETWVEPSPGLVGNLLYQDFSRNIYGFLQRGREAGATGVTAYNVPDLSLDKNYACLAEFSWNSSSGSISHFHIRYAQATYGQDWRIALEAYDLAERIMGCYPMAVNVMDQLLHYFNNFPHGRAEYPLDLIRTLARDPLALGAGIKLVEAHMHGAEELLSRLQSDAPTQARFLLECRRYRALAVVVTAIQDSLRAFVEAQQKAALPLSDETQTATGVVAALTLARERVEEAHHQLRQTMLDLKEIKAAYLVPGALRECSPLLELLGHLSEQFRQVEVDFLNRTQLGIVIPPALANIDLSELRALWHPWEF